MTIFENVDMFFCESCCTVVIKELFDVKKRSYFEFVKDVASLG